MKNRDKEMIRQMSAVLTEDVIRMIEDLEKIQKANAKAARKARAKKRAKAEKKALKRERRDDDAVDAIRYSMDPDLDEGDDRPHYVPLMEQAFGPMSV